MHTLQKVSEVLERQRKEQDHFVKARKQYCYENHQRATKIITEDQDSYESDQSSLSSEISLTDSKIKDRSTLKSEDISEFLISISISENNKDNFSDQYEMKKLLSKNIDKSNKFHA